MNYDLLNHCDRHVAGDEMWTGAAWEPVLPLHFGDFVGSDGPPCRRRRPDASGVEAEVCADIAHRQAGGVVKYNITVAENPGDLQCWIRHAYEEALDFAIYLKRAMRELPQNHLASADKRG